MDLQYKRGDLLEAAEKYILHGCNAQGVMGSGVAKLIRTKWPSAYAVYKASESRGGMVLGRVTYAEQDDGKTIINGITQEFYGHQPSWGKKVYISYEAIREVLQAVDWLCKRNGVTHVAMPKIGAGLGGGDWQAIAQVIKEESVNFTAVVYEI